MTKTQKIPTFEAKLKWKQNSKIKYNSKYKQKRIVYHTWQLNKSGQNHTLAG